MDIINALIDKYTKMTSKKLIKQVKKVLVIFFFLSACFLVALKSYFFLGILFLLSVGEFVYLSITLKKNMIMIYGAVGVNLILCSNLVLLLNVSLYSIQILIGVFDPILFFIILFVEILCLIAGFFYTRRSIRKGTIRKTQAAAVTSIAFVLPSSCGYLLSSYIIHESSVHIQGIVFTILLSLGSSMMMFVIGMVHVAILFYIKKYKIVNREISKVD